MNKLLSKALLYFFLILPVHAEVKIKSIIDGDKNAPIKLIVYESLTCGHCADFHKKVYPDLKKEFIDTNFANIEFRSFPLDLAALNASIIAHCENDGKSKILHFLYRNQNKWARGTNIEDVNGNLKKLIKNNNFNIDIDKCLNKKNLEDHILNDRINAVKKYDIDSTPTLIINGKKFDKTLNFKNIKKTLEKML